MSPMLCWIWIHSPLPYEYNAFNLKSFTLQFKYHKAELLILQVRLCLGPSRDQNIYGHAPLNSFPQADFEFELKSCRKPNMPQT